MWRLNYFEHSSDESQAAPAPKATARVVIPWLFGLAIMVAELFVTLFNASTGMAIHVFLLLALLVLASVIWHRESSANVIKDEAANNISVQGTPGYRFYLTLTLAPIIRILSLAIPMWNFPVMYWYVVTGAPLYRFRRYAGKACATVLAMCYLVHLYLVGMICHY